MTPQGHSLGAFRDHFDHCCLRLMGGVCVPEPLAAELDEVRA
jgi:hypothetical protein